MPAHGRHAALVVVAAGLLLAGCGSTQGDPKIDPLVEQIAAGGDARDAAADALVRLLNESDEAGRSAASEPITRAVDALVTDVNAAVKSGPPVCGSWADTSQYAALAFPAELVFDLAGRAGAKAAAERALKVRDPHLLAWAIRAAWGAGVAVPPAAMSAAVGNDWARSVLLRGDDGDVQTLPADARTLEARARADLAQWITDPGELGCAPTSLEFMGAVKGPGGRVFVYRFAGDGTKDFAGISGPWSSDGTLPRRSSTFSDFVAADTASAEAHAARIQKLVEAYYEQNP